MNRVNRCYIRIYEVEQTGVEPVNQGAVNRCGTRLYEEWIANSN